MYSCQHCCDAFLIQPLGDSGQEQPESNSISLGWKRDVTRALRRSATVRDRVVSSSHGGWIKAVFCFYFIYLFISTRLSKPKAARTEWSGTFQAQTPSVLTVWLLKRENKVGQWFSGTGQCKCGKQFRLQSHFQHSWVTSVWGSEWKSWLCCILGQFGNVTHVPAGRVKSSVRVQLGDSIDLKLHVSWTVVVTLYLLVKG